MFKAEQTTADELDWSIDYANFLGASEAIVTSSWAVESGIDNFSESQSDDATTIWLRGGTVNESYLITNTITTNSAPPRIIERSFYLSIFEPILVC